GFPCRLRSRSAPEMSLARAYCFGDEVRRRRIRRRDPSTGSCPLRGLGRNGRSVPTATRYHREQISALAQRPRSAARAPSSVPLPPRPGVSVSSIPPAKFFVNRGIVSSRTDVYNLLRPLLKQTVTYRYLRGRETVSQGAGWVERIVSDHPEI